MLDISPAIYSLYNSCFISDLISIIEYVFQLLVENHEHGICLLNRNVLVSYICTLVRFTDRP